MDSLTKLNIFVYHFHFCFIMVRRLILLLIVYFISFVAFANEPTSLSDSTAVHELREIVVKGSNLRHTPTGYVISLANKAIVRDKTATELFNFLPNVTVIDEVIKINGNDVTEIKIDGRRIDNYDLLKAIPASYIKSVKVNTFAGADNISTSTGGTIEIELKPIASLGYYGQLSGSATKCLRESTTNGNISGMIQGRYKRLSVFESAFWTAQKVLTPTGYTYLRASGEEQFRSEENLKRFPFQNYLALNMELNEDHDLGLNWTASTSNTRFSYNQPGMDPDMNSKSKTDYNTLSLLYRGFINNHRGLVVISAEWLNHLANEDQLFPEDITNNINLKQNSNLLRFEATVMHKVGKRHQVKAGAKYLQTHTNIHQWYTATEASDFRQTTIGRLPLIYASLQGYIGRVSYYGGLNWKLNHMQIKGQQAYSSHAFQPTINIGIPIGQAQAHRINVSYKYMLGDITYDAFNDRQIWVDPYTYSIGNPDIIAPSFHTFSLNSSLWNSTLNIGLNYKRNKNDIEWRTFSVPGSLFTYQQPVNMPLHDSYYLNINFDKQLFKFWTVSLYAQVGFYRDHYFMGDNLVKNTTFRHYYFTDNSFTFGKGWGGSLNAVFDPGFERYNEKWYTVWQVNVGIYKMLCHNRLMLKLSGTPARKHRKIDIMTDDLILTRKNLSKPQALTFSVRWTFNGGGNKNASVNVSESNLEYEESKASTGM